MSSESRKLSYSLAINEAFHQVMDMDKDVFLIGQGVKSPWYVGNTALGLLEKFGEDRVIDTPVSENAMTGAAVGAAICGMKAVIVHPRMDFMMYAFDPIINEAANWHYMFGGRSSVPVVVWGIINRGGEQAAQHSQALHAIFAHIPGLKVVMPATPYDAKGLMVAAIKDPNPVVFIDDRWLYGVEGDVPDELYEVPIGKALTRRKGDDVTIIAASYAVEEALNAAEELHKEGVEAEVVDLRTIKPLDEEMILTSVNKTGRAIVVDGGWKSFGVSAEIAALVSEKAFDILKNPVKRVALPDCPAPSSSLIEKEYYKMSGRIFNEAKDMCM
jgi:acetoin:2,6-dichlorophenolindophenol oxidoreductase subunit beta